MEKKNFTVFYSWQSDTDKKLNNFYIKKQIEKSIKRINKKINLEISLDKDTKNTTGSPHIVDTILKKINLCDIFICDLTIINNSFISKLSNNKKTPNPNVLIELGYALKTIGWERIICLINNSICSVEELPFDIKQNRVSQYSLTKRQHKSKPKLLENLMFTAINAIIINYENIVTNFKKTDFKSYDIMIFEKFNTIIQEPLLVESLEFATTNMRTNKFYYKFWDETIYFVALTENHYINIELQKSADLFAKSLDTFSLLCSKYFSPENHNSQLYLDDFENNEIPITEEIIRNVDFSNRYYYIKEPINNDWTLYDKNLRKAQRDLTLQHDIVIENYKSLRKNIKMELLI